MNIKPLEKSAESVGVTLARSSNDVLKSVVKIIGKYPLETVVGGIGLGAAGLILDWGNKVRGVHQIVNESGKRQVMNYQTKLLREMAANSVRVQPPAQPTPGFKQPMPIIPPLR